MPTKIKICGITRAEDARIAADLGADLIGLNFSAHSPRQVAPDAAAEIIAAVPRNIEVVGVFVNQARKAVQDIACILSLGLLQFHGEESREMCSGWKPLKIIKALRLAPGAPPADFGGMEGIADYFLLDSFVPGIKGGSGRQIASELLNAPECVARMPKIFLAGGLTAENVAEKVRHYRPFAVDVASGVESAPGIKSAEKLRRFISAVREADAV